ncbi:MAG: hypothetical protein QM704_11395 [Anaeromyxobacteraceae bacterium]
MRWRSPDETFGASSTARFKLSKNACPPKATPARPKCASAKSGSFAIAASNRGRASFARSASAKARPST